MWCRLAVVGVCLLQVASSVKVKVVMHSDQEDSKIEEEELPRTEQTTWDHKKREPVMPYLKRHKTTEEKPVEYDEEKVTTEKYVSRKLHPNDMIFPLIYSQSHVNSMFKYGENWYTWATEKRTDGSKAINYYICYEEPKRCDDVGWERTDGPPKCAFQIDSVLSDDRACINSFGIEPHSGGLCDGGEQMKVSEMVRSCGPRIRSLWRFVRVERRPPNAAKPADVNSLVCEDEEECFITVEYRIHHDRITFSLHEPTRGQTFKSVLKREMPEPDKEPPVTEHAHKGKKISLHLEESTQPTQRKKFHLKMKAKPTEGKGTVKEHNDSGYNSKRRHVKNKIKVREDVSDDISD